MCQRRDSCGSGRSQPLLNVAVTEIHVIELQPLRQPNEQHVSRGGQHSFCSEIVKSFSLYESRRTGLLVYFLVLQPMS